MEEENLNGWLLNRISAHMIFRKTVFLFVNYPTELSYLLTAVLFDPGVGISSLPL